MAGHGKLHGIEDLTNHMPASLSGINNLITDADVDIKTNNIITVSVNNKTDFNSIKSAIDYASTLNPSASNGVLILVSPGVYTESDTINLPSWVVLKGEGQAETTLIESSATSILFNMPPEGIVKIEGFKIVGSANETLFYNNTSNTSTLVGNKLVIKNGGTTFDFNGGRLSLFDITLVGNISQFVHGDNDAFIELKSVQDALPTTHIDNIATILGTSYLTVLNCSFMSYLNGGGTTTGITASENSRLTLVGFRINVVTDFGVQLSDNAELHGANIRLPTSPNGSLNLRDDTNKINLTAAILHSDYINLPANLSKSNIIQYMDIKPNDEGTKILGEFVVGTPQYGRESVFGRGDSFSNGMLVSTWDETSGFIDISDAVREYGDGQSYTIPPLSASPTSGIVSLYISCDVQDQEDYLKFHGLKTNILSVANTLSGEKPPLITAYMDNTINGTTSFSTMSTKSNAPYHAYADKIFERVQSDQNRFGPMTTWLKSDPRGEGINRFWVKFNFVDNPDLTGTTIMPEFDQFKLHTSRYEINEEGFVEYFGDSRPYGVIPWSINLAVAWQGMSPDNQDLYIYNDTTNSAKSIGVGLKENNFVPNEVRKIGLTSPLPATMDTSYPIKLFVYYQINTEDVGTQINIGVDAGIITLDDMLAVNTSNAPTDSNLIRGHQSLEYTIDVVSGMSGKMKKLIVELDFSKGQPSNNDSDDIIFISLYRDGTNDTYSGNFNILNIKPTFAMWRNGAFIGNI